MKKIGIYFENILKKVYNKINKLTKNNNYLNWNIKNSIQVLNTLKTLKNVDSIHCFDFENLYTSLPTNKIHDDLLQIHSMFNLSDIINEDNWNFLVHINLNNNYILFNDHLFQQINGIPMGNNFSTNICNIFLFLQEYRFVKSHVNLPIDSLFLRFIDDLLVINFNDFDILAKHIYPNELILNKTNNSNSSANFLDLTLNINADKNITFKLFDKRNEFKFPVKKCIDFNSNLANKVFSNIIANQIHRFYRNNSNYNEFLLDTDIYKNDLINSHFPSSFLNFYFKKILKNLVH